MTHLAYRTSRSLLFPNGLATRTRGLLADFNRWDIVSVPFPYTNRPVEQRRPALVIGQHRTEGSPHLLWVLMITSASHRQWYGDVLVSDRVEAGLPAESLVRTAKIATIEAADARRIGVLPPVDRVGVQTFIRSNLSESVVG
ncbi:MAG: hypothetical protein B7Z58_10620 [Acidiphilium sp. 37-64-53]|nr:MAG: hypothetical protein B7Z58_10620 [Acidiphilium sp. 37-64-53]OZB30022.1 MAG: hypothetical protein B7X49_04560 [Acidiphilium sp. 34-64-41]